jgi:hypothetical protein
VGELVLRWWSPHPHIGQRKPIEAPNSFTSGFPVGFTSLQPPLMSNVRPHDTTLRARTG